MSRKAFPVWLRFFIAFFSVGFPFAAEVDGQALSADKIAVLAQTHAYLSLDDYFEFLTLPNDAHFPEQLETNHRWLEEAFGSRGFRVRRLPTGGIDLVLAEFPAVAAAPAVLFYLHVDGQAVDASQWQQPDPYLPVIKRRRADRWEMVPNKLLGPDPDPEWRVFARSAADDKGPICMFLAAWDALIEAGVKPAFNIKILFDGEEEIGSPTLAAAVEKYRRDLSADALVIMDGPMHPSNLPTVIFGARGIASVRLTTYGPRVPQHSGHYGNYAPNPALRLAQLLASMKDADGRVTIDGFYDGIDIDAATRKVLVEVPDDEEIIRQRLGIAAADKVGATLQESLQYPSLNIRGMASAWVGQETRTIVPATATAEIDIRLVVESDPNRLVRLIKEHIQSQGYRVLDREPTEEERLTVPRLLRLNSAIAYRAFRTPFDAPAGRWLASALTHAYGQAPVKIRTMGGSVPIAPFIETLNVPAVILPLVNSDNNQHSPNENMRLGNYFAGVQTLIAVLAQPFIVADKDR